MKLRNGKFVDCKILGRWDKEGRSNYWIAIKLEVSLMGLWKIRKRLNCGGGRKGRSDKGVKRVEVTVAEKRREGSHKKVMVDRGYWTREVVEARLRRKLEKNIYT